jgi:hypothetical protein
LWGLFLQYVYLENSVPGIQFCIVICNLEFVHNICATQIRMQQFCSMLWQRCEYTCSMCTLHKRFLGDVCRPAPVQFTFSTSSMCCSPSHLAELVTQNIFTYFHSFFFFFFWSIVTFLSEFATTRVATVLTTCVTT